MVKTNIIEAQREKLKISKRQFAIKIGISRQAYYDILDNKSTRTETLDKIAAVLGLSAKDLLKQLDRGGVMRPSQNEDAERKNQPDEGSAGLTGYTFY